MLDANWRVAVVVLLILSSQPIDALTQLADGRQSRKVHGSPPTYIEWTILVYIIGRRTEQHCVNKYSYLSDVSTSLVSMNSNKSERLERCCSSAKHRTLLHQEHLLYNRTTFTSF